jgi:23S rRNA (uracil1939-C5)-methyltransferase
MRKKKSGLNIYQPAVKTKNQLGSIHQLAINRMSHDGRGIAELDHKVAFVEGALSGETVSAALTNTRGKFSELVITKVIEANEERVTAPCEYYQDCGGCSLQHWDYDAQLAHKDEGLQSRLAKFCDYNTVRHPLISAEPYHYRHRARLTVDYKGGAIQLGFKAKASNRIIAINDCQVLTESLSKLIVPIQSLLAACKGRFVEVSLLLAQNAGGQNSPMLGFVSKIKLNKHDQQKLLRFADDNNLQIFLRPQNDVYEQIDASEPMFLSSTNHDYKMHVQAGDFTQVNPQVNDQIVDFAINCLAPTPEDNITDLFCGLGNFTLPLAALCHSVTGVEINSSMVNRLGQSAKLNGLTNISPVAADLLQGSKDYLKPNTNKVLLDPPRAGALEVCKALAASKQVKTVVYVSCDPATLARDIEVLCDKGFAVVEYLAADMFAQTAHCEAVVHLARQ